MRTAQTSSQRLSARLHQRRLHASPRPNTGLAGLPAPTDPAPTASASASNSRITTRRWTRRQSPGSVDTSRQRILVISRWRREHDERWDAKRLEAYASYGLAVKRFILMASRISASRGLGPRAQPLPASEENLEQLAQAEVDRATAWEQVLLIGDPATIAAARRWHQRAWELEHFAR